MRLTIDHTTTYQYRSEVHFHPHRMMLRPRGGHDLQVLEHTLSCAPMAETAWSQDVFGNLVVTATFGAPAKELRVASRLVVETFADPWPTFQIAPSAHAYPFEHTADELIDLAALCTPQPADPIVARWARGFIRSTPTDTLSLLKDLNTGVSAAASYRPRDEEGTQTAAETLEMASGSCRDLAALFIQAARQLGFGARAVSGYIFDTVAGLQSSDSTHAWAQVYLPGAGWISFDPTHGRLGAAGLVAVAAGRCNAQIMPIVGAYLGQPEDFLEMKVEVNVNLS